MIKDIAIYGFGGFGREVACLINAINEIKPSWNLIGYFDDGKTIGDTNRYGSVLGGMDELNDWASPLCVVIAIATPTALSSIVAQINNDQIDFPNLLDPSISYSDKSTITIGKGNIIASRVGISCDVTIGDFNLINSRVGLGHDCVIGSFNSFGPSTRISGNSIVGNYNFFGVSSIVLQGLKIGDNTRIGAGSVIIRNTKDNHLYVGNPAKKINL